MGLFRKWWADEPSRFWSALVIFLNSVIALVVALEIVTIQSTALAVLYLTVLNGAVLLGGEAVRRRVSPTGTDPIDPDEPGEARFPIKGDIE